MSFIIPNEADAAFADQSEVDSVDFGIIAAGLLGDGVLFGCTVTEDSPTGMSVSVAEGWVSIGGVNIVVSAGDVTISAADGTNPRFDLITVDGSSTKAAVAGTPAANPVFPSIPADEIVLAAVFVPANDTAITVGQIVDKRVFIDHVPAGHPDARPLSANSKDDEFDAPSLDAKWTAINQETATIELDRFFSHLFLTAPAAAGDDLRLLSQSKPSGNFTMEAKCSVARRGINFSAVGLFMRDSTSGRITTMYWDFNLNASGGFPVSGHGVNVENFTDFNTFNAFVLNSEYVGNEVYLRWVDDGTNFDFYMSPDGRGWVHIGQVGRTSFLAAPDQIGVSWTVNNANFSNEASVDWFRVT